MIRESSFLDSAYANVPALVKRTVVRRRYGRVLSNLTLAAICLTLLACSPNNDDQQAKERQPAESLDTDSEGMIRRTVPFITLRNRTGSPAASEYFGGERNSTHTGYCDVSWTPIPMMRPLAKSVPFYIPHGTIRLEAVNEVGERKFWRKRKAAADRGRPLLYIHGYNIGFEKGCGRAAIFREKLRLAGRFLLFSWPSNDAVLNYTHDESDIFWSVGDIEKTLERMRKLFGAGNFDVVGHSMGTRGAFIALVRMSDQRRGKPPLLNHLVLLAADIDAGIFRQYLEAVRPLARHMTIYVSDNDSALTLSEEVHGYPRLGMTGLHLKGLDRIEIIDVSETGMRRASGHLYHLYNDTVINDLDQLLNKDRLAAKRAGLRRDLGMGLNYWKLFRSEAD